MCGLHIGSFLRKEPSPILSISISARKLFALPEWDSTAEQKSLRTTARVFPPHLHPFSTIWPSTLHYHCPRSPSVQTLPFRRNQHPFEVRDLGSCEDAARTPCPPAQVRAGACPAPRTSVPADHGDVRWSQPCTSLGPRCARTGSSLRTPRHQISCREGFLLSSHVAQGSSSKRGLTRAVAGDQRFGWDAPMRITSHLTVRKKGGKCFP